MLVQRWLRASTLRDTDVVIDKILISRQFIQRSRANFSYGNRSMVLAASKRRTLLLGIAGFGIASTAAAYSVASYYKISLSDLFPTHHKKEPIVDLIPEPPAGENRHPIAEAPWWYRWFITGKRAVHLVHVFAPFLAVSIFVSFEKSCWGSGH